MLPMNPLVRVALQGLPTRLGASPTSDHRCPGAAQRHPTPLAPPQTPGPRSSAPSPGGHRLSHRGGPAPPWPRGPPSPSPPGGGHPHPGAFPAGTPARLVPLGARLLLASGTGFRHRRCHGCGRGPLARAQGPKTPRQPAQGSAHRLCDAVREARRSGTPRGHRVRPWPLPPPRSPCQPCRVGHVATDRAGEPRPVVRRAPWAQRGSRAHGRPPRRRGLAVHRRMAPGA